MILNAPRSSAELSPRLQAISVAAADKFEEPEPRPLVIPRSLVRRVAIPTVLIVVAISTWFALRAWESSLAAPSSYALKAEEFRARAHQFEEQAGACRELIATGKSNRITFRGSLMIQQQMARRHLIFANQQADIFRKLANQEERKNQGFTVP